MEKRPDCPSWSLAAYARLLRENRDFRLLWTAQIVSEIGDWFYTVALYSLLLELTGKASAVGLAVVLQLLPQVFAAPTAGVLNDRLPRRTVMIFADVCRAVIVLSMLLVRSADMVWLVWVLLFLETLMWALFEPGRSALIPRLARSDEERLVANALSSTTWAFNLAIGAGLGGLVAYAFGRQTVFILNALSFAGSALLLASMRVKETHHHCLPAFRAIDLIDFKPILEGVRYVRRDPRRVSTLLVKAGMGLLGAHWVILPIFGERIFPMAAHLPGAHAHTSGAGTFSMSLLFGARGVGTAGSPASVLGLSLYYCASKASYCNSNNGNLQTESLGVLGVDQNFTYDALNRLGTANEATGSAWAQTFGYDAFGNRWVVPGSYLPNTAFTPTTAGNFNATTNRLGINSSAYDFAGNQTAIGGFALQYDAENR